jgi:hypothetical protein
LNVIGSSAVIGVTGYDLNPVVRPFGNRWLVVWENQITHDNVISTIRGRFIETNGTAGSALAISTSGDADIPDVAIAGTRALISWHEYTSQDGRVRSRLMDQDGSFPGGQFLINDANNRQWFATCAWDGGQFVVAWTDYRSVNVVEQLRGDIYAARVSYDGVVTDPDGIQITSGPLPEDLAAAVGSGGETLLIFSKLNGAVNPEIQRMGYRVLENTTGAVLDVTLTPVAPPLVIPAPGGSFNFNISLLRMVGPQAPYTVWTRIKNPNGTYTAPILGPVTINTPVGVTITRLRTQNVPGTWAAGLYTYLGYANSSFAYPAMDSSSFTFTKSVAGSGPMVWDTTCSGEPFPGEESPPLLREGGGDLTAVQPNPFNPITAISYELRAASYVSLRVYDTTGRLVATLVDGTESTGVHSVHFDGSHLASGIYLARLQAGEFTAVQKLVLLK